MPRLIDADALKKSIEEYRNLNCVSTSTIIGVRNVVYLIDNAPTVADRYDEGFRDGYAQCINDKEERKENNRLFQKGGAEE